MQTESEAQASRRSSVCVVTTGIALYDLLAEDSLSMMALAQRLSARNDVTLLWVPGDLSKAEDAAKSAEYFSSNYGIKLEVLGNAQRNAPEYRSFGVYGYLKQKPFDTVYFPLEQGLAYYTLQGKETGLYEAGSRIIVVAHSPAQWVSEADRILPDGTAHLKLAFMEKYCAGAADKLICVSASLQRWFHDRGWVLAQDCRVAPALSPLEWLQASDIQPAPGNLRTKELVLVASHRFRDGMTLFCDMLDEIGAFDIGELRITAIGDFGKIVGENSGGMLIRRGRRWPFSLRLMPGVTIFEGIQYAKQAGGIAVIPNLESAAGYCVSQCLLLGVPFVATSVGGNVDQLPADSASLAKPDAASLASALARLLDKRPSLVPQWNESKERLWVDIDRSGISQQAKPHENAAAGAEPPLISIVVTHQHPPPRLMQTIETLRDQDYPNFEVILVAYGDRGREPAIDRLAADFAKRGWRIVKDENKHVGAARNAGLEAARGEMIIFLDEDDVLLPRALSLLASAMQQSGSDICAALESSVYQSDLSQSGDHPNTSSLPVSNCLDLLLLANHLADTVSIYRRSVLEKVGPQLETHGRQIVDWEFLVRATLAGLKLRLIPEVLSRRRVRPREGSSHPYDDLSVIMRTLAKHGFKGLEHVYGLYVGQNLDRRQWEGALIDVHHSPSDLLHRELAELAPNSPQAIDLLARIAAAEGREGTAIGLLAQSQVSDFTRTATELMHADPMSLTAVRAARSALVIDRRLTNDDLQRMETATSVSQSAHPPSYVEKPDRFFVQSTNGGISVAVLAAACPPSTTSVLCVVSLHQAITEGAEFLVRLSPMREDPVVAAMSALNDPAEGSSGWVKVSAPYKPVVVEVNLASASAAPANLVLAIRTARAATKPVLGCFSGMIVRTSLEDRVVRRPRLGAPARAWTDADRRSARLVTEYTSELPLLLFPKEHEGGIFLRPSVHGPVAAVIENGFPPFAREVRGSVEIAHDEASPFEFALALSRPNSILGWKDTGPEDAVAFSGWIRVEKKLKLHDIKLRVRELAPTPMSLSIAIRLPQGSSPTPSNAFWRSLLFLWDS